MKKVAIIQNSGTALDGFSIYQAPDNKMLLENGQEITIEQIKTMAKKGWIELVSATDNNPTPAIPTVESFVPTSSPSPFSFGNNNEEAEANSEKKSLFGSRAEAKAAKKTKNRKKAKLEKKKTQETEVVPGESNKILSLVVSFVLAMVLLGIGFAAGYIYCDKIDNTRQVQTSRQIENAVVNEGISTTPTTQTKSASPISKPKVENTSKETSSTNNK